MEENCGFGICWPNAYFKVVAITLSHDCELVGFSSLGEIFLIKYLRTYQYFDGFLTNLYKEKIF